ncbi:hypothetical protein CYY_005381 [Polysphondylium violaceum]|uniref:Transmembrane protein n=1 Tax=Polysphondylium violaceum TaxID=133409 RepID=A0A8J4V6W8_9MYCE|nr:hypothetical protein CYY_005381 [Polysphondylium violaceum]
MDKSLFVVALIYFIFVSVATFGKSINSILSSNYLFITYFFGILVFLFPFEWKNIQNYFHPTTQQETTPSTTNNLSSNQESISAIDIDIDDGEDTNNEQTTNNNNTNYKQSLSLSVSIEIPTTKGDEELSFPHNHSPIPIEE